MYLLGNQAQCKYQLIPLSDPYDPKSGLICGISVNVLANNERVFCPMHNDPQNAYNIALYIEFLLDQLDGQNSTLHTDDQTDRWVFELDLNHRIVIDQFYVLETDSTYAAISLPRQVYRPIPDEVPEMEERYTPGYYSQMFTVVFDWNSDGWELIAGELNGAVPAWEYSN